MLLTIDFHDLGSFTCFQFVKNLAPASICNIVVTNVVIFLEDIFLGEKSVGTVGF